jgi:hypothetical protein
MEKLELQTRRLAQDFLGRELQQLSSIEQVVEAVGRSQVILLFPEHQLVATESLGDRLVFFNPAATDSPPGTPLPAGQLPERRVEEEPGEESASLGSLAGWLSDGRMRAFELS